MARVSKKILLKPGNEPDIAEYLIKNPAFFIRHSEVLDNVKIPHQVKGTMSLVEAQQERYRERIKSLTDKIKDFGEIAAYNDTLFRTFFGMYNDLYQCQSLKEMNQLLNDYCRDNLFIPHTRIILNENAVECHNEDKNFVISSFDYAAICNDMMKREKVSLGKVEDLDRRLVFKNEEMVFSRALIRVGELGILAFGHAHVDHYHVGLDTSFIEQLADYLALLLPRFVKLKV